MTQFRKKPVVVTAITFDQLVAHGIATGGNVVNGMPWSFTYAGHAITHENDSCYLIPTLEGTMKMGRDDMLITGVKGEIYPCKRDIFEATYDAAPTALPLVDPGPDSLERAMVSKTYTDGTTAFGPAPLPDVSPAVWAKPLGKDAPELTVSLSDLGLEREIQAKADKGPRVTPTALQAEIVSAWYINGATGVVPDDFQPSVPADSPLSLLTICVLVLRNGFTVHGVSACASPENFNEEIGRRIARENAEREIWPLLGFRLRDELARPVLTEADAAADLAGTPRPS